MKFLTRLFLLILLFSSNAYKAFGQANVRLNIVLYQVQKIEINPNQTSLTLIYSNLNDYQQGVELTHESHISVFSTEPFEVKVLFTNRELAGNLPLGKESKEFSQVRIKASSNLSNPSVTFPIVKLSTSGRTLINATSAIIDTDYDVTYYGPGDNSMARYLEIKGTTSFSNDVLYSIEAK